MPEAIATTKRKFYKALDALSASTNAPALPSASQTASSTSSSKRSSAAAFDEARERVRKRLRQSTSTDSLNTLGQNASVISLPSKSSLRNTSAASRPPPNFSPWSQETFLARLKTFSSVSLWHPKPDGINEVEWAKRGWVCVDVNTVACKGGCGRRVVVSVDTRQALESDEGEEVQQEDGEDEGASFEEALAERYKSQIVEGHALSCLWRQEGCKDDNYRLPVVRPSVWQPELRKRFRSLLDMTKSIEHLKTRSLDSFNEKVMTELPRDVLGLNDPPEPGSSKSFEIAMHGWRGSSESGNDLLHCDACFQRVGLWMYQPDYRRPRSSGSGSVNDEDDSEATLDLTELHRDHCPWRNSVTQKATGSLDGLNACQILQRVVSTAARDHRRRSTRQEVDATDEETSNSAVVPVQLSREEIARTDKERESRLRRLKNLLNIKRRPTTKAPAQKAN